MEADVADKNPTGKVFNTKGGDDPRTNVIEKQLYFSVLPAKVAQH
jgi:hypothetical protein